MKSNYELLGKYISPLDVRNKDLAINNLLGVSIEKCFIPSIANIVGTDLSSYKVVRTGQFAYGPVTSRNGEKVSVAYLDGSDCIISSSYSVFEVSNPKQLNPEYLMLWFSRPEFDRYARYKSHGSVREIFGWDELCMVELPVPPLEKQLEIVASYKAITERIALKKRINDNLAAAGISILSKRVGTSAQINKTRAEIEQIELPCGWTLLPIREYCQEIKSGATPSRINDAYWCKGQIPWLKSGEVHNGITISTEEFITEAGMNNSSAKLLPADTVLMAMYGVTAGEVGYLAIPATTNQAVCGMVCSSKQASAYLFFSLLQSQTAASRLSNGGAQDNLSKGFIEEIQIIVPDDLTINSFRLDKLIEAMTINTRELSALRDLQSTLLAQLSSR